MSQNQNPIFFSKIDLDNFINETLNKQVKLSDSPKRNGVVQKKSEKIKKKLKIEDNGVIQDFILFQYSKALYLIALICENRVHFVEYDDLSLKCKILQTLLIDVNKEELFVCKFIWLFQNDFSEEKEPVLLTGGTQGIIYIINSEKKDCIVSNHMDLYELVPFISSEKAKWKNLVLAGYKDGGIYIWDVKNKIQLVCFKELGRKPPLEINSIDWHQSGNYFVAGYNDQRVNIWEIDKEIEDILISNSKNEINKKHVNIKKLILIYF